MYVSDRVRISAVSFRLDGQPATRAARIEQAFAYLAAAARDEPDLILLPELYETLCVEWRDIGKAERFEQRREAVVEFAETEAGPLLTRLSEFAARHGVSLVSDNLVRCGDQAYNQATFFGRDGAIAGRYRKVQPTEAEYEGYGISPGDVLDPVELDGVRYGALICNDQAFPEICQIYALQGVQVLLHPSQAAGPTETIRSEMLRTRAHDSSCYLAVSGFCGAAKLAWSGRESRAYILDYNGYAVADCGHRQGHVTATLDLGEERWTSWCRDLDHRRMMKRQLRADLYARYYARLSAGKENLFPPVGDT